MQYFNNFQRTINSDSSSGNYSIFLAKLQVVQRFTKGSQYLTYPYVKTIICIGYSLHNNLLKELQCVYTFGFRVEIFNIVHKR